MNLAVFCADCADFPLISPDSVIVQPAHAFQWLVEANQKRPVRVYTPMNDELHNMHRLVHINV